MGRRNGDSLPKDKVKWRTALYIRLSREDGGDVSDSVIHQEERLTAFISAAEDEFELTGIYKDDGYSGTDTNRDGFQRMLKDIKTHKVNCVIVKDLSRLSRSVSDAAYYIENFFIEYNVRFISLELPALDSYKHPEHMNSILVPIQNVINDDFCRQTSVKVRGTFNTKRGMGQFIGAFAPYGYLKNPEDKHGFIIDGDASKVVKDIFEWYVKDGLSKGGIARRLNGLGIPSPAAYKKSKGLKYKNPNATDDMWGPKTVREILSNQTYAGDMVQGRYRTKSYKVHKQIAVPKDEWYIVKNTHAPVIGRDMFALAQKLQEKDTRQPPGGKAVYLLSGFVRCADCKKAMVRSQGGGKVKTAYYQCRTHRDKSKNACGKHSIRADALEDAVFNSIKYQTALVSDWEGIIDEINKAPNIRGASNRFSELLNAREKEMGKVTAIKDSLYTDWKNGDITRDDYRRLKEKYEKQEENIAKTINALKSERKILNDEVDTENPRLQKFLNLQMMNSLDRSAVVDFVDVVYVRSGGEVEIVFNFRFIAPGSC